MKNIRVLIDTNILLDLLTEREPFSTDAQKIFELCIDGKIDAVMAAHSITNIFYILRKDYTDDERRDMLLSLCDYVEICSVGKEELKMALSRRDFADFEDCLQDECAKNFKADYIVTRNTKDFASAKTPAIMPKNFLLQFLEI